MIQPALGCGAIGVVAIVTDDDYGDIPLEFLLSGTQGFFTGISWIMHIEWQRIQ